MLNLLSGRLSLRGVKVIFKSKAGKQNGEAKRAKKEPAC
jgi:hypothetical protein